MKKIKQSIYVVTILLILCLGAYGYYCIRQYIAENKILKEVVGRLEADSRIAQALVSKVEYDENTQSVLTTIKFLEYDSGGLPLRPRYFTFPGNIIQFQSLVIRFDDIFVRKKDLFRGKSAYLFWKVFMLDGDNTVEYELTPVYSVPQGYKLKETQSPFEEQLWRNFWKYALDPDARHRMGIRNAQIEAPGTLFEPGMIYTIKIEHDGGMRIDASQLPEIIRGEQIPE